MKRHITIFLSVILLSITVAARAAQPQVNIKCQPQTCTVPDTGGTRSVTIMYDNASGSISTVPDIIRRNALTYDTEHVEKIEFPTYATAVITFKHRPDGARTEDKITFGFTIRVPEGGLPDLSVPGKVEGSDTPQYVEQFCQCELSYIYPALSQVIGGLISASDKAYNPGQRVEQIRSEMPAMSIPGRNITYSWQRRTGTSWQTIEGATDAVYTPQPIGKVSEYYRRAAYDGYQTAYSNEVEIRALASGGTIGMEYEDEATTIRLTDVQQPTVPASQCRWESSADNETWTIIGSGTYAKTVTKPAVTTFYRRVATSLDGKDEYPSNTVIYNLVTPVSIRVRTATDAAGSTFVEDRTYYDGLGREMQSIAVGAAPDGRDVISLHLYDGKGREANTYLPFSWNGAGKYLGNAAYKQDKYYKQRYSSQTTCYPFTHTEYDSSPLDRPVSTVRPGAEYRADEGHAIRQSYGVNSANEVLRIVMSMTFNAAGGIQVKGYHPAAELYKTSAENEDGAVTITFTDAEGRTVLSRRVIDEGDYADTYYVYDYMGRLRWAISPEGSDRLVSGASYAINCDLAKKYCFRYVYDQYGNVSKTYIPGRDEPDMAAYDSSGRLTSSSTAAMRKDGVTNGYRYDNIGRMTAVLATEENRTADNILYTYDSYLPNTSMIGHGFIAVDDVVSANDRMLKPRGMKTHERVYEVHDKSNTAPKYSLRTFYYDLRGRIVQMVETSPMGRTVRVSYKYDYTGNPLICHERYTLSGKTTTVVYAYEYDSRRRVTGETTSVDGEQITDIAYTYDELGQLKKITAGSDIETTYTYNIQGWLTKKRTNNNPLKPRLASAESGLTFNRDSLIMPPGVIVESLQKTIFEQTLEYFSPQHAQSRYAGNIAETSWRRGNAEAATYAYTYDRLGRLVDSRIICSGTRLKFYGERDISYDKNTNILSLTRYNGLLTGTQYRYTYDGNRKLSVTSGASAETATDYGYQYDIMGNISKIGAENLLISYNYLNLPKQVTKMWAPRTEGAATHVVGVARPTASYLYLADGTKVQAIGETGQGYEYVGSLRLSVNGSNVDIESIPFAGGRIVKTTNGYEPQYYITDHLGSTRTIVKPKATVVAEFDYMPYGTQHAVATAPTTEADYKYTGKEQQGVFGLDNLYDSQARFQYVTDGMFLSHDPLSEQFPWLSTYSYCAGNPIMLVDPDGRAINFYEVAQYLELFRKSKFSRLTDLEIGPYSISALYDSDENIVGYTLMRDRRIEYMADTISDLKHIENNLEYFITGANLFYINGTPSDGMVAMIAGDVAKGLGQQWIEAAGSLEYWLYCFNTLCTAESTFYKRLETEAAQKYIKKAKRHEWHHITPKYTGVDPKGEMVYLPSPYHQMITNEFRALYPYGQGPATEAVRKQIEKQVYRKYPIGKYPRKK